ncbi:MAG TPA: hypothetical protein PL151_17220 [Phycisphaerae bacterium]|nr:hypothetical protein [Phycisphaerae bacterium]HOJ75261.1 hypothetical protein [Phycisphaerae bacterium]HPP28237.1 hypothetical protein [Phycisphaerae bacterium]HPZ97233.1 hypothetical protein [Phycisphaerae bacterium]HQE29502.1 hypothetical protein [Phycisphaerae bacterium]
MIHSRKIASLAFAFLAVFPGLANANIVFDFNDWSLLGGSSEEISKYMTDVLSAAVPGGSVQVSGAVGTGFGVGIGGIFGKEFTLQFSEQLTGVGFDGWVLWETTDADFQLFTLDEDGQVIERVFSKDNAGLSTFHVPVFDLNPGVYGLKFTDHGLADVGICNLIVKTASCPTPVPVPAPGAAFLALAGLGITGWAKRRLA